MEKRRLRGFCVDSDRLRELRLANKWTQEEAGHQAGISDRLVRKAEAGHRIDAESIKKLAAIYTSPEQPICIQDLLHEPDRPSEPTEPQTVCVSLLGQWLNGIWLDQQLNIFDKLTAADVVFHCEAGVLNGRKPLCRRIQHIWESFSDFRLAIDGMTDMSNSEACRWRMEMTNSGAWLGRPPTQSRVSSLGSTLIRFETSRIKEVWEFWEPKLSYLELARRMNEPA